MRRERESSMRPIEWSRTATTIATLITYALVSCLLTLTLTDPLPTVPCFCPPPRSPLTLWVVKLLNASVSLPSSPSPPAADSGEKLARLCFISLIATVQHFATLHFSPLLLLLLLCPLHRRSTGHLSRVVQTAAVVAVL